MPHILQFTLKPAEIIDLSIIHNYIPAISRDHWLMAKGGEIQDGKTTVTKGNAWLFIHPDTPVVRPPVNKRNCHPPGNLFKFRQGKGMGCYVSGNTAHYRTVS